jgi:hypothetical protein
MNKALAVRSILDLTESRAKSCQPNRHSPYLSRGGNVAFFVVFLLVWWFVAIPG